MNLFLHTKKILETLAEYSPDEQKRALADNLLEGSDSGGKLFLQEIMQLVEGADAC